MTWRVLIADDEPLARKRLRSLLANHPDFTVAVECASGAEVLQALRGGPVDLLLLDIRMPKLDGVQTVERLRRDAPWLDSHPPAIIFVTASDEHAVDAFDLDAADYVVKPVDIDRFARALDRARQQLATRNASAAPTSASAQVLEAALRAIGNVPSPAYARRFGVRDARGLYFVRARDVDRVEADGNYVALVASGRRHLVRETMQSAEARLDPADFIRVHRSAIVRIDRIARLEPSGQGEFDLTLTDGTKLTSSRAYRARIQRLVEDGK